MNLEFPGAVPEIPVSDLKKAASYYESNLGFSIDWGGEGGGIAGISKGHCRMFLTDDTFREHYLNAGPVLVWLNLDSKEQVNELSGFGAPARRRLFHRQSQSHESCMSSQLRILMATCFGYFMILPLPNERNNMKNIWLTLLGCSFFSFAGRPQQRAIREARKNVPLDSIQLSDPLYWQIIKQICTTAPEPVACYGRIKI